MNNTYTTAEVLLRGIQNGTYDEQFKGLYGDSEATLTFQKERYSKLISTFIDQFGASRECALFSVAGRSELSGNHTDHNHGCVIAASISLDIIAIASPRNDSQICIHSEGFGMNRVDISTYTQPVEKKFGTSAALVAGVCVGFADRGYAIGGFDACTTSNVLKGSGLSSSAAFEDMVGTILSHLYNGGGVDNVTISMISQFAENKFFGKPCGLMDQVACAYGGIVAIDFADPTTPVIAPLPFDMSNAGYHLCIVDTGGNHADLTDDYAAVPAEMKAVAKALGGDVLRNVGEDELIAALPTVRRELGDRAALRALHFFGENRRVADQKAALTAAIEAQKAGDEAALNAALDEYFGGVLASGRSSFCYLQNVYTTKNIAEQGLSLALCLAEKILNGEGAFRVHGGGFAGTIQAYVPTALVDSFKATMDAVFGEGACADLTIRLVGACRLI
ncbi:MAG: galactokinase [Clostridia bacterium]|nr:galactokinase [Clostridia bacterium]